MNPLSAILKAAAADPKCPPRVKAWFKKLADGDGAISSGKITVSFDRVESGYKVSIYGAFDPSSPGVPVFFPNKEQAEVYAKRLLKLALSECGPLEQDEAAALQLRLLHVQNTLKEKHP